MVPINPRELFNRGSVIVVFLVLVLLAGVSSYRDSQRIEKNAIQAQEREDQIKEEITGPSPTFEVIVYDGCEYIKLPNTSNKNHFFSLTHKGNCNNPIHQ